MIAILLDEPCLESCRFPPAPTLEATFVEQTLAIEKMNLSWSPLAGYRCAQMRPLRIGSRMSCSGAPQHRGVQ